MIKKTFVLVIGLLMLSSLVFAQGQGIPDPGNGSENPEIKESGQGTEQGSDANPADQGSDEGQKVDTAQQTQNQGEVQQIQTQEQVRAQINDIKQEMEQKKQQLQNEAEGSEGKKQQVLQNQNQVRVAAQTLSQMANMLGGVGKQVSEIAKNFNNSVQATIKSEEKIQTRSSITRFFAGGDAKAAQELETEVTQNQQRIQELKQLKDECDCDEEVKAMMQEQIQQMEQEQTRLQELAESEKKSKGLLGWLWK